jgi:hypothetical protein
MYGKNNSDEVENQLLNDTTLENNPMILPPPGRKVVHMPGQSGAGR